MTDVDTATGCALVASMTNEVVVRDHSIRELLPLDPMRYDEAVLRGSANALKRSFDDDPRQRTAAALSVRSSRSATDQHGPGETEDCADACHESRPAAADSAAVARTRSTAGQTGGETRRDGEADHQST